MSARSPGLTLYSFAVILPVLLLVVGGGAPGRGAHPVLTNAFVGPSNCTDCPSCVGGHTGVTVANSDYQKVHEFCMEQVGCPHPQCSGSALLPTRDSAEAQQLHFAALDGDVAAMAILLAEAPAKYHLNAARHAFQVVGCKGDVIVGHIPLTEIQLSQLDVPMPRDLASR